MFGQKLHSRDAVETTMHVLTKREALEFVRDRLCLFRGAELANPFASGHWTLHFIAEIAEESWTFTIPESSIGGTSIMLLYTTRSASYQRFALANYYTSLYSPIISTDCSAGDRARAITELVQQVIKGHPRCSLIDFHPLDSESPDTECLQSAFGTGGWYAKRYERFGNWYLPCTGFSFDEYMKGRPSQLINTWHRKRKKFADSAKSPGRLEMVLDESQVDRAMDAYDQIYSKSWKEPEPYKSFVRNWARLCARNGWLRLGLAWLGDTPVAAQFWFTAHNRAYIFKLAYDEEYAKLSAGTVLSAHMFKHAIDVDRVAEIDYLTGDDDYKRAWMTNRRQRIGLLVCNPWTPRGLLASAKEVFGDVAKSWNHRSDTTR